MQGLPPTLALAGGHPSLFVFLVSQRYHRRMWTTSVMGSHIMAKLDKQVVYLQPAGNSCCLKNPVQCLFYHLYEGAVPWYPISFSTNLG